MYFPHVAPGQRREPISREFHNALVDLINRSYDVRRGFKDNSTESSKYYKEPRKAIYIRANDDIDTYSIFTIDYYDTAGTSSGSYIGTSSATASGTDETVDDMAYDPRYPKAFSKQVDNTSYRVFVVNEDRSLGLDGNYLLNFLGDEKPVKVHYDPDEGIPEVGDEVGVKPGTYKVALGYNGITVVSGPDLEEEIVWVIKHSTSAVGQLQIAHAILSTEMCGESDFEDVRVEDAILLGSCESIDLSDALILNTCRHQGMIGDRVKLVRVCCDVLEGRYGTSTASATASGRDLSKEDCENILVSTGSATASTGTYAHGVWDILDVQRKRVCVTRAIEVQEWCMVAHVVTISAELCGNAIGDSCTVLEFIKDCTDTGPCDTTGTGSTVADLNTCCFQVIA